MCLQVKSVVCQVHQEISLKGIAVQDLENVFCSDQGWQQDKIIYQKEGVCRYRNVHGHLANCHALKKNNLPHPVL